MARRPIELGLVLASIAACVVSRFAGWHAGATAAGMIAAGLAPGLMLIALLRIPCRGWPERVSLAAALSLPFTALVASVAAAAGASPGVALAVTVLGSTAVLALAARTAAPAPSEPAHAALLPIAVGAAAVVLPPLLHPWVREWSDAWFHAAVFNEVVVRGVPPGFPHFAGHSLPYPWAFHVWLAGLAHWVGGDAFTLIAALNVLTAALLPIATYALALALGASPRNAVLAALVLLLGIHPLAPAILLLRVSTGATGGVAELDAMLRSSSGILVAITQGFRFFDASLWARLWTPTAFNFALVIAAMVVVRAADLWMRGGATRIVGLALVFAALLAWHTLTAYTMLLAVCAACVLAWLFPDRDAGGRRAGFRRGLLVAAACVAGYALAFPYLRLVTRGAGAGQMLRLAPVPESALALVVAGGPILVLAALGLFARGREWARPRWLLGAALGLTGMFLVFDLPGVAEEKIFYPLMLVLALPAGAGVHGLWLRGGWSRAALQVLALLGIASAAIVGTAFFRDATPRRELFADRVPGVELLTADEERALAWVRRESPAEAVFLQVPRPKSNEPILVYGRRRLYLGPAEFFYRAIFFPSGDRPPADPAVWSDLSARARAQQQVFSGAPLDAETRGALVRAPQPLYVWWDRTLAGGSLSPDVAGDSLAFRPVFVSEQVRLYRIDPQRVAIGPAPSDSSAPH